MIFFDGDFQSPKKFVILRGEADLAGGFEFPRVFGIHFGRAIGGIAVFFSLVEADSGFQHQKNIIAGSFYFADRARYAVRVGEGFVNCISQLRHQLL